MNKRPLSVTIISWLFIAVGVVALAYHSTHLNDEHILWILIVRFLALVGGIGLLLRQNWARWLIAALAYHVYLSIHHKASELIIHAILFLVIVFFLFRRMSTAYFHRAGSPS